MPGIINNNVPPITLRVTSKEVSINGQIKLLDEEKLSFHPNVFVNRQSDIALARAIVTQIANTKLAAKTIKIIILLIRDEDGRYTDKYREIVPRADKTIVGKNISRIKGTNLRQFLAYKSQLLVIISVAVLSILFGVN